MEGQIEQCEPIAVATNTNIAEEGGVLQQVDEAFDCEEGGSAVVCVAGGEEGQEEGVGVGVGVGVGISIGLYGLYNTIQYNIEKSGKFVCKFVCIKKHQTYR